jgi:hypothetical protein
VDYHSLNNFQHSGKVQLLMSELTPLRKNIQEPSLHESPDWATMYLHLTQVDPTGVGSSKEYFSKMPAPRTGSRFLAV